MRGINKGWRQPGLVRRGLFQTQAGGGEGRASSQNRAGAAAVGKGEECSHDTPCRRRLGEEMPQSLPRLPDAATHWPHPPGSQRQGSLFDAVHRGQSPTTQGIMEKGEEWLWRGKGTLPGQEPIL